MAGSVNRGPISNVVVNWFFNKKEKLRFVAFTNFQSITTPTMVDFKVPMWCHWMWTWDAHSLLLQAGSRCSNTQPCSLPMSSGGSYYFGLVWVLSMPLTSCVNLVNSSLGAPVSSSADRPANRIKGIEECKVSNTRISLVVQGLRLHTLNAGGLGLILGQRTRFHMPQLRDSTCCSEVKDSCVLQPRPGTAK